VLEGFLSGVKMDPNAVLPVDERNTKEDSQAGKFEFQF
jgi:hypothetical protein